MFPSHWGSRRRIVSPCAIGLAKYSNDGEELREGQLQHTLDFRLRHAMQAVLTHLLFAERGETFPALRDVDVDVDAFGSDPEEPWAWPWLWLWLFLVCVCVGE